MRATSATSPIETAVRAGADFPLLLWLEQVDGYPVLDRSGRSSVDGLFFTGAAAAFSLGPSTRFIAGTHVTVPSLVRALTRSAGSRVEKGADAAGELAA